MGWWMLFGSVMMVAFWGGVIALVVWIVKRPSGADDRSRSDSHSTSPFDIAKERYARGEISKQEYDQIRRDLS
ncbi:MAG: SHOCT domain-containing protein [Chloroflexi bacterium]|nr:SHOCT domain-containing protein [Chloroflexota bacterium]MBT7080318.1 SHOCT domain-containing protein [Chloroflexota bacterium]MBT7289383.1 SHOCT domain-containing protein [Chloroflexota bacterium]